VLVGPEDVSRAQGAGAVVGDEVQTTVHRPHGGMKVAIGDEGLAQVPCHYRCTDHEHGRGSPSQRGWHGAAGGAGLLNLGHIGPLTSGDEHPSAAQALAGVVTHQQRPGLAQVPGDELGDEGLEVLAAVQGALYGVADLVDDVGPDSISGLPDPLGVEVVVADGRNDPVEKILVRWMTIGHDVPPRKVRSSFDRRARALWRVTATVPGVVS